MSKIGDLIVRLQLKYQDYEKGLKKAEKDTKGFASNLGKGIGKIKAGLLFLRLKCIPLTEERLLSKEKR